MLKVHFVPGEKQFTKAYRRRVKWIVLHTMEVGEISGMAERITKRFTQSDKPKSFHYAADDVGIWQLVEDQHVAWAAPGANHGGIQIELTGKASQTAEEWDDGFSQKMLGQVALLCAALAAKWSIPIVKVSAEDMVNGVAGFAGHVTASEAFKKSNHYDPGPNFPWDKFLGMVKAAPINLVEFDK